MATRKHDNDNLERDDRPFTPIRTNQPTVVRPHRMPPTQPLDIADMPTARLGEEQQPTPPAMPTLPEIPPMPALSPKTLTVDKETGRIIYSLSDRIIPGSGDIIRTAAVLGRSGGGWIHRQNSAKTWNAIPQYLTFREICFLYVSALDAINRAKGDVPDPNLPEGA